MPDWRQYVRQNLRLSGLRVEREAEVIEDLAQQLEDAYAEGLHQRIESIASRSRRQETHNRLARAREAGRTLTDVEGSLR